MQGRAPMRVNLAKFSAADGRSSKKKVIHLYFGRILKKFGG